MAYKLADGSLSTNYKVGDDFIVGETKRGQTFAIGSVVKLRLNDGSSNPSFSLVAGECCDDDDWGYFNWDSLRAVKKKQFTKSDLEDGMRVIHKDGDETVFIRGEFRVLKSEEFDKFSLHAELNEFTSSLEFIGLSEFDIIRVTDRDGTVLFEREPEKVKLELEVTPEQAEAIRKQLGR